MTPPLHTPNKSLPIAYLLWLFTGIFGGHRWYLGKRWSAFFLIIASLFIFFSEILIMVLAGNIELIINILNLARYSKELWSASYGAGIMITITMIVNLYWISQLFFDIFWIRTEVNRQNKGLTQQQVEAFE